MIFCQITERQSQGTGLLQGKQVHAPPPVRQGDLNDTPTQLFWLFKRLYNISNVKGPKNRIQNTLCPHTSLFNIGLSTGTEGLRKLWMSVRRSKTFCRAPLKWVPGLKGPVNKYIGGIIRAGWSLYGDNMGARRIFALNSMHWPAFTLEQYRKSSMHSNTIHCLYCFQHCNL